MADERMLTIPLKRELLKVPRYRRSTKAVRAARKYLIRQTKDSTVRLGQELNQLLLQSRRQPVSTVKVKVYKLKDKLIANLMDAPIPAEEPKTKEAPKETTPKGEVQPEKKEEKLEAEKKEVLKHPPEEKKQRGFIKEKAPKEKKAGQQEMKKEIFSKTQKPKHEKKK